MIRGVSSIEEMLSSRRRDFADIGIVSGRTIAASRSSAVGAAAKKAAAAKSSAVPFYKKPIFLIAAAGGAIFLAMKFLKGGGRSARPFGRRRRGR